MMTGVLADRERVAQAHGVVVTLPMAGLPADRYAWAVARLVDAALSLGAPVVAVGLTADGGLALCRTGCCRTRMGSTIAVPDGVAFDPVGPTERVPAPDGRWCTVFGGGPGPYGTVAGFNYQGLRYPGYGPAAAA